MKFSITTAFAIAIAFGTQMTSALIVPTDQADGVYEASIDANGEILAGTEVKLLKAFDRRSLEKDSLPAITPNRLNSRQLPSPSTRCNQRWLNQSDYNCLMGQVDNFGNNQDIPSNTARWYTCGSAVIYMCNYSSMGNPVRGSEFRQASALMNSHCGVVKAGWVIIDEWNKDYGRDTVGVRICRSQTPV
ncbi:hypothetical protein BJ508DRAFT_372383 [Ascobolus immersus RN42]|uniref:Ecp2 effector protein domain-containing protein n=1 Tax=Ascobolus immersus RN42 TaxID=1160509 RepID=A0A3N4IMF9_ASCIM|nr:hypothetical protein BJ508DRAFT_372383 [Ascobolus immersus RN42]